MSRSKLAGKAQTVLGTLSPDALGVTLPHEHLFADLTPALGSYKPTAAEEVELYYQPVALDNLWWVVYHPAGNLDNLLLQDEELAISEALFFKKAGGGTIVDMSNQYMGRNPQALARLSRATGLHIIMASGYYLGSTHPADMDSKTEEEISQEIVREVTDGVGNTGIRAGIIGEIGCSEPLTENERKALRAAAAAQQRTGAPLSVHPGRKPKPDVSGCREIISILSEAGADVRHTVLCHIDRTLRKPEERQQVATTGCYLEYDIFGWEGYHMIREVDLPNDNHRINEIMQLAEQGYLNQILISQDICWKSRFRSYGGHGYEHILRNVVPVMRLKGMSEEQINTLLVENPRRFFQFK
jgi:phosphotriesterase-related protein